MEVICLEEPAFYALIEQVYKRLKTDQPEAAKKWISGQEAMQMLHIKSKTSLQNLRDSGRIRFSQPQKKVIVYDRDSILEYLEQHAQNTF